MSITITAFKLCFVTLTIESLKMNIVSAYVFPEMNLPPLEKFNLNLISSLYVNMLDANCLKSFCLDEIKNLASTIYKKISIFIQNTEDLVSHFNMKKFFWNRTREHSNFSCSKFNASDFKFCIENELFGQHIVSWSLPKLLNDHLTENKPMKPLLISFQGSTGSGKSFVSKIIIDSLVQEGFNRKFVHTYYGSRDFFHEKFKKNYRKRLLHEIPFFLSLCDRSVFIFEEMDKMVPGVIDVILPFIYFSINSTDIYTTNSMFIFISNSGAKQIEEIVYDAWIKGVERKDITLSQFTSSLKETAYNEPGGLQCSEIIKRNLIDVFLPFLPLEREHVKQCIFKELTVRKMIINKNNNEYIADQIIYHPPEFELFAESGCKRVSQKVDLYASMRICHENSVSVREVIEFMKSFNKRPQMWP